MAEAVHAVSSNIRIIFCLYLNFHTTRVQAFYRFGIRQHRPASVNRRARVLAPQSPDASRRPLPAVLAVRSTPALHLCPDSRAATIAAASLVSAAVSIFY